MRIMHISNNYTPYAGGLVSSLNGILPALQDAGHEVMLIVPQFTKELLQDFDFVYRIPSLVRFTHRNNPCSLSWLPTQFIEKKVQQFRPDIIHVHHPFLLGFTGSCVARAQAIPCIFTYHTMYDQYAHYVPLPSSITVPYITQSVLNFCKNQVNAIVAPSRGIKQWLVEHEVTTPIQVIPSPVLDHFFQEPQQKTAVGRLTLLYVGRFTPEKNVAALIDLFASLDQSRFQLVLVGFGIDEQELRQRAYRYHGLSQRVVTFMIKPSLEQLLQIYRESHLFLFPSVTDTQGIVLAEAMAAGLPVIAFDGCGQRDSVINGENGFLVSTSAQMKEMVELLEHNPLLLSQLSHNARTKAQLFSKAVIIERLITLYEGCRVGSKTAAD